MISTNTTSLRVAHKFLQALAIDPGQRHPEWGEDMTPVQKSLTLIVYSFLSGFLDHPSVKNLNNSTKPFKNEVKKIITNAEKLDVKLKTIVNPETPYDQKVLNAVDNAFSKVTSYDPVEQAFMVARGFWNAYMFKISRDDALGKLNTVNKFLNDFKYSVIHTKSDILGRLDAKPEYPQVESLFNTIKPKEQDEEEEQDAEEQDAEEQATPEESKKEQAPEKTKTPGTPKKREPKELSGDQRSRMKKILDVYKKWTVQKRRDALYADLDKIRDLRTFSNSVLWKNPERFESLLKKRQDPDHTMRKLEEALVRVNMIEFEKPGKKKKPEVETPLGAPKSP